MAQLRCKGLMASVCAVLLATVIFPMRCAKASALVIELGGGFGEFSVVNRCEAISLNSAVAVQQLVNGDWVNAGVANLYLREACSATRPPRCRELGPDEEIKAVRWTGNFCSSQCPGPCRFDGPAPLGTYQFAVTSCDGKETFVSPEFRKDH
jgi:hypothetical protein